MLELGFRKMSLVQFQPSNTSEKTLGGHSQKSHDRNTVKVASNHGTLAEKAKQVNKINSAKRLYCSLLVEKVGTNTIEKQALVMSQENLGVKITSKHIVENRDPRKVFNIVKLKIKYYEQQIRKVRKEYIREKERLRK